MFVGRLAVGLGEPPVLLWKSEVKDHFRDLAQSREFDWRPYSTVYVGLVVIEVVACPEFVGLADPKAEGNVDRTVGVSGDGPIDVNRKWRRKPTTADLVEGLLP